MRTAREIEGFGRQEVVMELVEVAPIGELVVGPYSSEALDEFSAPPARRSTFGS
jgi:hypothetical protein